MALQKIYEEGHADLFPVHLFVEGWAWKLKDKAGMEMKSNALVLRNHGLNWYTEVREQTRVAEALFKRLMDGSFEEVRDNTTRLLAEMEENTGRMERENFSGMTDAQLVREYREYCAKVVELNSWGTLVTLMEMGHESVVTKEVFECLGKKGKAAGIPEKVAEAVGVLCSPVQGTFLREKKIGAIRAAMVAKMKGMEDRIVQKEIGALHKKYSWVSYGYVGPEMSRQDFEQEIAHFARQEDLGMELENALNEDKHTRERQRQLEKQFSLDAYGLRLFGMARTFMFQKEYRKQVLYHSFYAMNGLRKEIARRAGMSVAQLAYAMPEEIDAIMQGKFDVGKLNERMKLCVYLAFQKELLAGREAEKFLKENVREKKFDENAKELKGQVAFSGGEVVGIARIVLNAHDLKKMREGDILVSPATSPVMVPGMKMAGAIVTDQGGLTCHAAIVSRELRKPCVIGTGTATKVLKDGERVRVDSLKGIVARLGV